MVYYQRHGNLILRTYKPVRAGTVISLTLLVLDKIIILATPTLQANLSCLIFQETVCMCVCVYVCVCKRDYCSQTEHEYVLNIQVEQRGGGIY